jgi:hypothetical protein
MQLALAGSSSSLHSEVCKALKRASACFTTNFLERELAFARLPPSKKSNQIKSNQIKSNQIKESDRDVLSISCTAAAGLSVDANKATSLQM